MAGQWWSECFTSSASSSSSHIGKCLEENGVHAAIQQRADLLLEHGLAVDALVPRLLGGDAQRADAACDGRVLAARGLLGQLGGGPVDFVDPIVEAVLGQPRRICAETVRLDEPRPRAEIALVDAADDLGLADAQLLEAALQRDTASRIIVPMAPSPGMMRVCSSSRRSIASGIV